MKSRRGAPAVRQLRSLDDEWVSHGQIAKLPIGHFLCHVQEKLPV